jgi:uncharacterized protein (TIGR03067 family)
VRKTLFAAIVSCASVAAASGSFGVHLVTSADAPGSRMWRLALPGGAVEEISLDSAALLDDTAIASADAQRAPDGGGEIRLVLTSEGARRFAEVTSRNVGRRLGIVVAGRLRAAPVVVAGITNGVLVVGGLKPAEAEALARTLGPPSPPVHAGPTVSPNAAPNPVALRLLEGTWNLLGATVNGRAVPDPKFSGGTWTFHGGTLVATNGVGETARFELATDAAAPDAFLLRPVPPSREQGGWMIFRREGERLTLAFFDGFSGRPEGFTPAPKKVVLVLVPETRRTTP